MLNLNKILEPAKTIAIGGHVRPDGDCVGSCMAMYQYIQNNYPDKEVDVFLEEIPSTFYRIKGTDEILHEIDESKHYDLFIVLDCGDTGRLEFSVPLFVSAGHTLCIDHHVSNICFAQDNYVVPDASSTSELVYNLIDKDKITKEIAEALYLGIVHDTGVFQYSCAGPSTFRAAAELLETGIDAADLIMDTFYEKSYARMQIFGRALVESFLFMEGKCIVSYIRKKGRKAHLYHCDHRGLPLALISEDGNTAWSAEYDEWGNQLNEENPHHVYQPYRLPGQQHDEESGLYYNRHRYYDPLQGRYITQDPMGLKGGWNLYQYPLNPLQQIDPMGLLQTWDDARSGACTGGVCGVLSRIIGPSKFDSTADAALDALKETQNRSLCNDMEYSGIVCKDTNGKYFASKAETDNLRKESYPLKRKCPTGTDRVAAYHTHGADSHGDYVDEFFSSSDKNLVRSKDNNLEAFYLATPDGRFEALNNKGEYIFIRNSVPGLSSVCIPYHD